MKEKTKNKTMALLANSKCTLVIIAEQKHVVADSNKAQEAGMGMVKFQVSSFTFHGY